jgi:hypothetical protein
MFKEIEQLIQDYLNSKTEIEKDILKEVYNINIIKKLNYIWSWYYHIENLSELKFYLFLDCIYAYYLSVSNKVTFEEMLDLSYIYALHYYPINEIGKLAQININIFK